MKRRKFITFLGGAAMWSLAARAQVSAKRPLVAWLGLGTQSGSSGFVDAFLQGMQELGYVEGRDFDFVYRFANGYIEQLPILADEVVRLARPMTSGVHFKHWLSSASMF
jgi:putative ABC transport system substrate-binding protein